MFCSLFLSLTISCIVISNTYYENRKKLNTTIDTTTQSNIHHLASTSIKMDHSESELYTIKTQFYTYQHQKVIEYDVDQFSEENQLNVLIFQIRSSIALSLDASKLIENGKLNFPDNESTFQLLQAWNDLKTFGTDDSTYFDDIASASTPTSELQAVLTAIYLVKVGKNVDQAIQLLTTYRDNSSNPFQLEACLVLIQLYLVKGSYTPAYKIFNELKSLSDSTKDSIIYQVLESWILSIKGESDNINNAYYFYDEILSSDFDNDVDGKFRLLNSVFVLTLQLKHYPESAELLTQIDGLNYTKKSSNFIANKITADYLTNNGANVPELLSELKSIDQEHQLLVELEEKNKLFDEIVEKYQPVK